MEGYEVISFVDDEKVGKVVRVEGDYLIVEQGMLRKQQHAVPQVAVDVDHNARQVRTTLSRELIEESPRVDDGGLDRAAIARHYGLAEEEASAGEGYGETVPGDPARSAEYQEHQAGLETAVEQRARIREGTAEGRGGIPPESPALLGDRYKDVPDEER